MVRREQRTPELYRTAGAWCRILDEVMRLTITELSKVLASNETDALCRMESFKPYLKAKCNAEDRMFEDCPHSEGCTTRTFYGALHHDRPDEEDLMDKAIAEALIKKYLLGDEEA